MNFGNKLLPRPRSKTEVFLVGQPGPNVCPDQLPTNGDVLLHLHHRKLLPEMQGKTLSQVASCPQCSDGFKMICNEGYGCFNEENKCVVFFLRGKWARARVPIEGLITEKSIR